MKAPVLPVIKIASLNTGDFPVSLKVAITKTLLKKFADIDLSDFRFVSVLPVLSYESVVFKRFYSFLEKKNYSLSSCQFVFILDRSTSIGINNLPDYLYRHLVQRKMLFQCFWGFTKHLTA